MPPRISTLKFNFIHTGGKIVNLSEEYAYALKVMRLERELAARYGNQTPYTPSAAPPSDLNARTPAEATARAIERYQKIVDAVYGRNQDPLKPGASPREVYDKILYAVYHSRRD
jgi:hypothetical protein